MHTKPLLQLQASVSSLPLQNKKQGIGFCIGREVLEIWSIRERQHLQVTSNKNMQQIYQNKNQEKTLTFYWILPVLDFIFFIKESYISLVIIKTQA